MCNGRIPRPPNEEGTMTVSLFIRRMGLLLVVALGALALAGPAQSGTAHGVPPQSAIDAASANWAAKAKLLDVNGRPLLDRLPPQSAIDAASANWAAKAKLLDVNGRPLSSVTVSEAVGSTGLDRRDFGMGAGAMLGLVLLSGGVFAGVYFSRRSTVRTHPSS
jgi:hypothetical protein